MRISSVPQGRSATIWRMPAQQALSPARLGLRLCGVENRLAGQVLSFGTLWLSAPESPDPNENQGPISKAWTDPERPKLKTRPIGAKGASVWFSIWPRVAFGSAGFGSDSCPHLATDWRLSLVMLAIISLKAQGIDMRKDALAAQSQFQRHGSWQGRGLGVQSGFCSHGLLWVSLCLTGECASYDHGS